MKIRVGGTPVSSLETRWLHSDHAQALKELREHRRSCIQCGRAKRKKNEPPCAESGALLAAEQDLLAKAREAARLDAAPHPDQEALW
jgi:hypothetical protein